MCNLLKFLINCESNSRSFNILIQIYIIMQQYAYTPVHQIFRTAGLNIWQCYLKHHRVRPIDSGTVAATKSTVLAVNTLLYTGLSAFQFCFEDIITFSILTTRMVAELHTLSSSSIIRPLFLDYHTAWYESRRIDGLFARI